MIEAEIAVRTIPVLGTTDTVLRLNMEANLVV